jgi:hypothetical protein
MEEKATKIIQLFKIVYSLPRVADGIKSHNTFRKA